MDFITIATFSSYYDAVLPKNLLENQGITCYLKDENSVTINPVLTNSIGGIKLQVPEKDYKAAEAILIEGGYKVVEYDHQLSPAWVRFDTLTRQLPIIGKLNLLLRAIILLVIVSLALILPFYSINRPPEISSLPAYNSIEGKRWCVAYIKHHDKEIKLRTTSLRLITADDTCKEVVLFDKGMLSLPGINTPSVSAMGHFDEERYKLTIREADTFQSIYEGVYDVQENYNQLILTSKNTVIYCVIPGASSLFTE